jgi:hypothetical protein
MAGFGIKEERQRIAEEDRQQEAQEQQSPDTQYKLAEARRTLAAGLNRDSQETDAGLQIEDVEDAGPMLEIRGSSEAVSIYERWLTGHPQCLDALAKGGFKYLDFYGGLSTTTYAFRDGTWTKQ